MMEFMHYIGESKGRFFGFVLVLIILCNFIVELIKALKKEKFVMEDNNRRIGRTTRLADQCVQEVFIKGECFCVDHYYGIENPKSTNRRASRSLAERVVRRLESEHGLVCFDNMEEAEASAVKCIYFDRFKNYIKLYP